MRVIHVAFALLMLAGVVAAQAPLPKPAPQAAKPAAAPAPKPASVPAPVPAARPYGTMAEVMRGILYPNSNVIFDVQKMDPGGSKAPGLYTGWQAVENSAVAIAESASLLTIPGRLCENGKPAPVRRADWVKFSQLLADAGKAALKAARSKNQDAVIESTNDLGDACAQCHEVYRKRERCTP